jgi:LacI family transcriptional regulator
VVTNEQEFITIKGYLDALKKHHLPLDEELLIESNLSTENGREKMQELLNLEIRPDAVYVAGDYAALGALQVLNENNIKVPDEMALVGFGNEPFTNMVTPSITSINQHSAEIGRLAAETFLNYTKKETITQELKKQILDAELIVRASSNKKTNPF